MFLIEKKWGNSLYENCDCFKNYFTEIVPISFFLNKEAKRLANSHKSLLLGEAINVDFLKRVTLPVQPGLKCEHIAGPLK